MDITKNIDDNIILASAEAELLSENAILKYQNCAFTEEIAQLRNENAELRLQNTELIGQLTSLRTAVEYYEAQARLYRHQLYGQSSEKTQDQCAQNDMDNTEAEDTAEAGSQPEADPYKPETEYKEYEVRAHRRRRREGKREDDLSRLPVERIEYELAEGERGCPDCGCEMHDIGVEIRREVEFIPAKYILKEHVIHKYACRGICKKNNDHIPIIEAESPEPLIKRSLVTPSAVAFISVQKYVYCVPLYRLERGFIRDGFFLSRQTMSNWIIKCVELFLETIYTKMTEHLLIETVLHSDATTLQVLREKGREAKTKSYEWVYRTTGCADHQIVIYKYTETKGRENPELFLETFRGYLHCDGDKAYRDLDGIILVGCFAHSRRKFNDVIKSQPESEGIEGSYADRAMTCINYLFHLERMFEGLTPEKRYEKRLVISKPIADSFFEWVKAVKGLVLPGFPIGKALNYALNHQEYLMNVFLDGRLELSNNRAERSVKPFVMGRKNWMFCNTPNGAHASSVIYSIIETAIENGLDPFRYIKYLLEVLPNTTTSGVTALLPWSADLPEDCRSRAVIKKVEQIEDDEY